MNATIIIDDTMSVSLPAVDLCDPAEVTIDNGRSEAGLNHSWTTTRRCYTKAETSHKIHHPDSETLANHLIWTPPEPVGISHENPLQ